MKDKVVPIGVKKKDAKTKIGLVQKHGQCRHKLINFDEASDSVECRQCGERLNPMWVIKKMAMKESIAIQNIERYQDEMKRLKDRSRTKCRHCGKMTPISKR